ncbi:galactitol-1-phosphate 5-dehydrogenase [Lachnospiraceae bacterium C1.1]|nr:galactitol-1-phosphate 5-dehydrogenase [Lachnospiraceae bacterium C1.1]
MKAWVLHDIADIHFEEIHKPKLKAGEVLFRVKAAGICGSDIPRIYKTGAHKMPLIPGHEFSGIVEGCGEGVSKEWIGKHAAVYPLIACGKCVSCLKGKPQLCRNYDYLGSRRDGAFAEYLALPAKNLMEIRETVPFEEAAMLEPMAVAVHAMQQGISHFKEEKSQDSNVVVCGMGTIGSILTMFLIAEGFKNIFVVGNKDSQKKRAEILGIKDENFCDMRRENVTDWLRQHGGADIYFECVGRNESVSYGIDVSNAGARIVMVGNPYSDMTLSRDVYWKILRNEIFITGSWNSVFLQERNDDDWHYVKRCLEEKKIAPKKLISHRFSIDELDKGFKIMRDKTEDYCKIMMVQ